MNKFSLKSSQNQWITKNWIIFVHFIFLCKIILLCHSSTTKELDIFKILQKERLESLVKMGKAFKQSEDMKPKIWARL